MRLFLLTYDRRRRALVDTQEFEPGQYGEATRLFFDLERDQPDMEVVLLEAASLDDLKRTHRRYFEDLTGFLQTA